MIRFLLTVIILTISVNAYANPVVSGFLSVATWNKPFLADTASTLMKVDIAYASNAVEYDWANKGGEYRPYVFLNVGANLPLWSNNFIDNKFGYSLSVPFSIDTWVDFFERTSAPVINASYRFGLPEFGFIHRIGGKYFKNYSVKVSPLLHESTHIGDELVIRRIEAGLSLRRMNVSYNYFQLQATFNDPDLITGSNHSFRAGFMLLYYPSIGWYYWTPGESDQSKVTPSKFPYELYYQYQYQSDRFWTDFQIVASFEIRNRSKYAYPYYEYENGQIVEYNIEEYMAWTFNGFIGLRYVVKAPTSYFSALTFGLRGYHGINPHGQFRSRPDFQHLGLTLVME